MNEGPPASFGPDFIEQAVLGACEEVLQLSGLGLQDGFAALGGDSLAGERLLFLIKDKFAVNISLAQLLEAKSLGAVAADIQGALSGRSAALKVSTDGVPLEEGFI
jgi:hypothetical protein